MPARVKAGIGFDNEPIRSHCPRLHALCGRPVLIRNTVSESNVSKSSAGIINFVAYVQPFIYRISDFRKSRLLNDPLDNEVLDKLTELLALV